MEIDSDGLIVRPPGAPIPNGPRDVASVLDAALRQYPQHEALVGRHARYTYAELDRAIDAAAATWHRLGVVPGSRVACSLPNQTDIVIAFMGAMRLGAIWVGINLPLAPPEKAYMLRDAEAEVMLTTTAVAAALASQDTPLRRLVTTDPDTGHGEWRDLLLAHAEAAYPPPHIDPHAPAALAYTSGTTGFPKGAVHSQHNMLWAGADSRENDPSPIEERHGVLLPLTLLNLMVLGPLFCWIKCCTCVCVDRIDPLGLRDWIRDERISRVTFAPPVVYDLLTHPDVAPHELASLRRPECGGSATPHALRELFLEKFGSPVLTGYGLTEAPTALSREMPGDPLLAGCSGRPFALVDVVIVDDEGNHLAPNEVGEICVRATSEGRWAGVYTPFLGYWRRPDATAETLRGGLLHTNDLGYLDGDGRLFVKDRRNDVINRGGANVYPAEVERVLIDHPAIAACAVLGIADERLGERVAAVVQCREGERVESAELTRFARERLARYKVPERWAFVERFERTPMGKIRKGDLRVLFG